MADNQLENWLKQGMKKGYSLDELKERALKHGYSERQVNDALKKIKGKKPGILKIIIPLILIILIIAVAWFAIKNILPFTKNTGIDSTQKCVNETQSQEFCTALITGNITERLDYCRTYNPNFTEEDCKTMIYSDFAKYTKDPSFCEKIASETEKAACLESTK